MTRRKLQQFEEIGHMPHVFQLQKGLAGSWGAYFNNNNPIILELACGKGDYTVGLARIFPDRNHIGMDIKGSRIWRGAKTAEEEELKNVAFLRGQIEDLLEYFAPGEVSEIWITFPDPHLPLSKARKRLTYKRFLDLYKIILQPNGSVRLKTDSLPLFLFSLESCAEEGWTITEKIENVYTDEYLIRPEFQIQTYYEKMHLKDNRTIRYVSWSR